MRNILAQITAVADQLAAVDRDGQGCAGIILRREARRRLLMEAYARAITKGLEVDAANAEQIYEQTAEQVNHVLRHRDRRPHDFAQNTGDHQQ